MRSLLIKDLDSNRGKTRQTMSPPTQAMKKAKCSVQQRYITVVSLSAEVLQCDSHNQIQNFVNPKQTIHWRVFWTVLSIAYEAQNSESACFCRPKAEIAGWAATPGETFFLL